GDSVGLYRDLAPLLDVERAAGRRADASPGEVIQVLVGQACGAAHARAIAGERGGYVLVDRAGGGALGIELGIVLVGLHQGSIYRARARARPDEARAVAVLSFAVLPTAVLSIAGLPVGGLLTEGLGSGK